MAGERRERLGNAARQVGVVLALPGAVLTFGALLAVGNVWTTPFWPGVVSGIGLFYAGLGTVLDPEGVVEEAADAEFGQYTVRTRQRATWIGQVLLVAGAVIVVASALL